MEKIEFLVGSEKRFAEFISNLNKKDKIALISHSRDIDGIVSAKVMDSVIDANLVKFVDYNELNNDLLTELKKNKINKTIVTDIGAENSFFSELEKFSEVLIIDHHTFKEDLNTEKIVFLNAQGLCAAYISYYLFSKIRSLEKLDWLVAIARVSDWLYQKNRKWLEEVYIKYGYNFTLENGGIKQESRFSDLAIKISSSILYFNNDVKKVFDSLGENFGEIGDLGKYANEVQEEIDKSIEKFWKERKEINERLFWIFKPKFPIGSVISGIISLKEQNKTLIIIEERKELYHIHARRQDQKENMAVFVKRLVNGLEGASGGGHIPAAGAYFLKKDLEKVMERLKEF